MKPPAMKTPALATIYLDLARIDLMGDPRPHVYKVVMAAGKDPETMQVLRAAKPNAHGTLVQAEEILDRTADPAQPIYLTSRPVDRPDTPRNPRPAPASVPREPEWPLQRGPAQPSR